MDGFDIEDDRFCFFETLYIDHHRFVERNQIITHAHTTRMYMIYTVYIYIYPPIIKHGVLENGSFIHDVSIESLFLMGFPIETFDYRRDITETTVRFMDVDGCFQSTQNTLVSFGFTLW